MRCRSQRQDGDRSATAGEARAASSSPSPAGPQRRDRLLRHLAGQTPPTTRAIKAPVLGLYGGDDARVNATIEPARAEMTKLGKVLRDRDLRRRRPRLSARAAGSRRRELSCAEKAWPRVLGSWRSTRGRPGPSTRFARSRSLGDSLAQGRRPSLICRSGCSCVSSRPCSRFIRRMFVPAAARATTRPGGGRHHHASLTEHLKTLASDEFEGRAPSTKGGHARGRISSRAARRAELEPAGDNGTFFQQVPIVESDRRARRSR